VLKDVLILIEEYYKRWNKYT